MSPISIEKLQQAAALFKAAKHAVVFTGAGISTPSGIPDFRSSSTGLWEQQNPMEVASLSAFINTPKVFFDWFRPLAKTAFLAKPNPAHTALAILEKSGVIKAVITQNIDNLHQRAGSSNVIEVHGSINTYTCLSCNKSLDLTDIADKFFGQADIPCCPDCRKPLKPDVILFEEMLPTNAWEKAEMHCDMADLILVAGSSLEVSPANCLPVYALRKGAVLIINNLSTTFLDEDAKLVFHDNVVDFIPPLTNLLITK